MTVYEIVGGVILLVVAVAIIVLTLLQHTHGQGLAGAIGGNMQSANNTRLSPADQMLAKITRVAGVIFFVVAIVACVLSSRPRPVDETGRQIRRRAPVFASARRGAPQKSAKRKRTAIPGWLTNQRNSQGVPTAKRGNTRQGLRSPWSVPVRHAGKAPRQSGAVFVSGEAGPGSASARRSRRTQKDVKVWQ